MKGERVTCIVSTIAGAPDAAGRKNEYTVDFTYASRAWILRNLTLPWLSQMGFDQLLVTGIWEPGPGYGYVQVPEFYRGIGDLLLQRQAGYEMSQGDPEDWVLYLNDDTLWSPDNPSLPNDGPDVLSPSRWTRVRKSSGERLNDGSRESSEANATDYVQFHATLVRRRLTQRLPWVGIVPGPGLDVAFTAQLGEASLPWRPAPEYKVWDVELGANLWS
jgi:hypothetical protein